MSIKLVTTWSDVLHSMPNKNTFPQLRFHIRQVKDTEIETNMFY